MIRISSLFLAVVSMLSVSSFAVPSPVISSASIEVNGEKFVMTDQVFTEGRIVRCFERGASLLYPSQVRATRDGLVMEVTTRDFRKSVGLTPTQYRKAFATGRLAWMT
jgi:hypothetical protein